MKESHPPAVLGSEESDLNVLLAFVYGRYASPSGKHSKEATLGLYFNSYFKTSPYSFCYHGLEGDFMGHSSPFDQDEPVEQALMHAWYSYKIAPFYWQVADKPTDAEIGDLKFANLCRERWNRVGRCVEKYKIQEVIHVSVYGSNEELFESSRLFYPNVPDKPKDNGMSYVEEMDKLMEEDKS
jgi:hypothetical protein